MKLKKWYQNDVCDGIRKHSKSIRKILESNNPLEAVSITLIQNLLVDAFGYDREWLLPEENISNKHIDIAIHHPKEGIMCEGKKYCAAKSQLNDVAKKQLDLYCRAKMCEWGILTDGIRWKFYWYPLGKTKKESQKITEVDFTDLPKKITSQYCKKFHIFHAKVSPQERREYAKAQDMISQDNIIIWLRNEKIFNALCQVIKTKQKKKTAEMNELKQRIYTCFTEVLPLPEGRNNPFDPMKDKIKKKSKKTVASSSSNPTTDIQAL